MFHITPLDASFGAEVRGWEPGRALSESEAETLHAALRENVLLVLRGHRPPSDEEFARRLRPERDTLHAADVDPDGGLKHVG